ncbi:RIP metalloprotease RseP [Acetilactobacillus jinshanensis]|uniref:Zinc metalloprotease n=1 Tax=Acetilactobacillus jinshanensis TaxID=1720083 RepID=A0A4P6ZKJ5_9LACO|nr:RIP metalloprotease RseP [Acetilactobacillus jinshanensis]QBP17952.1 RIP metalloprotease RseP [Acetilactobacillus jinshanensis]URL60815.1 RIP metalloprotease RseP [uncultured bacterium]
MISTIIAFIIIFGILVIVHEFGHFIVAKKSGIMVREFSVGMGPKIFYHRYNGTTYTLRLLPLGGYVRMAGSADDDNEEMRPGRAVNLKLGTNGLVQSINTSNKHMLFKGLPIEVVKSDLEHQLTITGYVNGDENHLKTFNVDHDATIVEQDGTEVQIAPADVQYETASVSKKLMTNFAGVFNNVLLAVIVYMLLSFVQGGVLTNSNQVNVLPHNSVARDAGIQNGDRIISIDHHKTPNWIGLQKQIATRPHQKINLMIKRDHHVKTLSFTTKSRVISHKRYGMIGIEQTLDHSVSAKLISGFTQTWSMTEQLFHALGHMIFGHFSLNDLGGPVAIFATTSQAAKLGITGLLQFLAFLSINLAIMNLLPIPALDGGKIILNLIQAIRRRPVSENVEATITLIGFALILVLMVLVTWNDIERYFIH